MVGQRLQLWLCFILVPLGCGMRAVYLGQDTNWDLLNYHLYNPYAYLNDRLRIDLAPAGLQTYFNPYVDIVYFKALSVMSPRTVGFLLGLVQGVCFLPLVGISRRVPGTDRFGNAIPVLLGIAGILSVGFLSELGTVLHDSLAALFCLVSLWLVISVVGREPDQNRTCVVRVVLAGVVMGVVCGFKLAVAIWAVSMCVGLLWIRGGWKRKIGMAGTFGVAVIAGLLLSGGYWFDRMWVEFGNPLFPQFNDLFRGSLARFEPHRDVRFLPNGLVEKLFYPVIFALHPTRVGVPYRQISWMLAYASVLVLPVAKILAWRDEPRHRRSSPETATLFTFLIVGYVLWLNMFGIYRYMITAELLIPLLLFIIANRLLRENLGRWGAIVPIMLVTIVNLFGARDYGRSAWSDSAYRVEPSVLSAHPEPAAVYLVGQPLAWIIPALDIQAPFIQLEPNILVSEAYWERARSLANARQGRQFAVLESIDPDRLTVAQAALSKLGLSLGVAHCDRLTGYIGSKKIEYRVCAVNPPEY